MLLRVKTDMLTVGMYVERFDGSWWNHPFWRSRFLIEDEARLAEIRGSDVEHVFIDTDKGTAPAPLRSARDAPVPRAAPRLPAAKGATVIGINRAPVAEDAALAQATETVSRSRTAVRTMFREARLGRAVTAADVAPLVEEIADAVDRNAAAMIRVTRLKRKNEYTYMHSVAVCALMMNLARVIGLAEETVREVGMAGLLHDIGKIAVPDAVLTKPGSLDEDEFALIRAHPMRGHELLNGDPGMSAIALDVCLHHHERVDGTGYPHGLRADDLSIHARMGAVCDVYDALTSNRSYKSAWGPGEALSRMMEWEGHFDPGVLDVFMRSIAIYPPGTLVRLRSNRLALVIAEDGRDGSRPWVRAFYATRDRCPMRFEDLRVTDSLRGDAIMGVERGALWFGTDWAAVRQAVLTGDENGIARRAG